MRTLLVCLFFSPLLCWAQKLALIDRNFQKPITMLDSISFEEATRGALPVYAGDMQLLINAMQGLVKYLHGSKSYKHKSFDLSIGNSKCIVKTETTGGLNRYNIVLSTATGAFKTSIVLVAHEASKRAAQRLTIFLDYLRNNASIIAVNNKVKT